MNVNVYTIRAFSCSEKGGNLAGVVVDASDFSDAQMQLIAQKVGYSETAFVSASKCADFKVRFFTPNEEVDLCGHATIATFSVLFKLKLITSGTYLQETKAGVLRVMVDSQGAVYMAQKMPSFYEVIDKDCIAMSLGITTQEIVSDLPVQIVSTGLKDIIVPVKSLSVLKRIDPSFEEISRISKKCCAVGYHVFCLETLGNATAHCRNFAPLYGIDEESATGSSSGALACYLMRYQKEKICTYSMIFEQGYLMGAPSEIKVQMTLENNKVTDFCVGGDVTAFSKRQIML